MECVVLTGKAEIKNPKFAVASVASLQPEKPAQQHLEDERSTVQNLPGEPSLVETRKEQKRSEKEYLNELVTNLIKSDGGNLDEYRRWSTRIRSNAALLQDNAATVQLMLRTTLGPLKDEIDRYILDFVKLNPGKGRLEVPCGDLLAYLNRSFLPSNDLDYVRETMESLRQLSGETLRVFNRKFRDLSELAYPSEQRSEDQKKLLIRYYIKGLASRDTARTVLKSSPASLHDAMTTAVDNDEVEDALQRLGHRNEEPMDISTIHQQQTSSMNTLSKQLDRMNTKLAKMELQIQQDLADLHDVSERQALEWIEVR